MDEKNRESDRAEVARRAYEISQGPDAGSPEENWHRAEREVREGREARPAPKRARTKKKSEDPVVGS